MLSMWQKTNASLIKTRALIVPPVITLFDCTLTGFRNANVENKTCLFIRPIRHFLAFSNFTFGGHYCFSFCHEKSSQFLLCMQIEYENRECVDNNYLKDACHLTTIILQKTMFRKVFSIKFMIEKSNYSKNTLFNCYYNHFVKAALKDKRKRKLSNF